MADSSKDQNKSKKVFDIANPSTTVPSPNSRSIIVNHGPTMKDPTIVSDDPDSSEPQTESVPTRSHELKIEPLNDIKIDNPASAPEAKPAPETSDNEKAEVEETAKVDDQVANKPIDNDSPDKKPDSISEATSSSPEEAADKTAQPSTDEDKAELDQEEQVALAEQEAKTNDLIETKKFFLPINTVEKRRNKRVVLIGVLLCILLGLVWLDVALDAGLISNGLNLPHTHFFALKH